MKNIVIGLFCLMLSNMILNLTLDKLKGKISLSKIFEILLKSAIIFVSSLLIYYAGYLNPTILVINMDGVLVNLEDALKMVYIAGIILYGYKSITELSELLKVEINIDEVVSVSLEEANTIYPDEELERNNESTSEVVDDEEILKSEDDTEVYG